MIQRKYYATRYLVYTSYSCSPCTTGIIARETIGRTIDTPALQAVMGPPRMLYSLHYMIHAPLMCTGTGTYEVHAVRTCYCWRKEAGCKDFLFINSTADGFMYRILPQTALASLRRCGVRTAVCGLRRDSIFRIKVTTVPRAFAPTPYYSCDSRDSLPCRAARARTLLQSFAAWPKSFANVGVLCTLQHGHRLQLPRGRRHVQRQRHSRSPQQQL